MRLRFIFILLILPTLVFAQNTKGEYEGRAVPYFYGSGFYIGIEDTKHTKGSCMNPRRKAVRLVETDMNSPQFKYKFSILLSAWTTGREVYLKGTGNCSNEKDEYVNVVIPR